MWLLAAADLEQLHLLHRLVVALIALSRALHHRLDLRGPSAATQQALTSQQQEAEACMTGYV